MPIFKHIRLHDAAMGNNAQKVKALLEAGADADHVDSRGDSVLTDAIIYGKGVETVRVLIAHGAKLDTPAKDGSASIHLAVNTGNADIVCALLDAKPDLIKLTDQQGMAAIHLAARDGRDALVRLLLARDPLQVELRDGEGNTPLHSAAQGGHPEIAALLLEHGAAPDARNNSNRNPLFVAQNHNRLQVADMLRPLTPVVKFRPAAAAPEDEWKKLSGERIARVSVEEAIGYRVTEIFNFASRAHTTLYQNLETKAETVETQAFGAIAPSVLGEALAEFRKRGGTADDSVIGGLAKLPRPQGGA